MVLAAVIGVALLAGPTTPLAGTVVSDDGTPVVGAELVLTGPTPGESPVVARGRSGEGGAFRLERPAGLSPTNQYMAPTLWVVAQGRAVTWRKFSEAVPGADEPVRVVLRPATRTEVRVEAPDGSPMPGARVNVQRIKSEPMPVPEPVADLTERTTGPDGLAVLTAFRPDEVGTVDVAAKGFGIQPRWLDPDKPGPKRVRLLPVVALKGRLVPVGGEVKDARGWRVRAWTNNDSSDPRTSSMAGYGSGTTDDEGRFTIAELAPGSLRLSVFLADKTESDLLPDPPKALTVREGRENVLEIPLRRASTLTGRVVEHGTCKPVSGMRVILSGTSTRAGGNATTNAEGRYTFHCLSGKAHVWGPQAPPGYVSSPGLSPHDVDVPEAPGRVDLGTTELLRAALPLKGEVRDESGKPVAGAAVRGQWFTSTPLGNSGGSPTATTDAQGRFALDGIAPGAKVTLTARRGDRVTAAPVSAAAGSETPVTLTAVPGLTVALAGRVVGADGGPVEGGVVTLRSREAGGRQPNPFGTQVVPEDRKPIRTGRDGVFRTPKEFDREGRDYQAEVVADGFHPGKTPWVPAGGGDVLTLPGMTLRRSYALRTVAGRVLDRGGEPVAGVLVFQAGDGPRRTEATTDDAGRFRLAGVYSGPALVFAEKAGFRFGGAVVGPDGTAEVRLARSGEPPASALKTLPSPLGRDAERAMARDLLAPMLTEARAGALGQLGSRVIPALARVDPDRVLAMIEERVVPPSTAIVPIALARSEDDPREAIRLIEDDLDPASRARGFLALAEVSAAADRDRPGGLLDRAFAETLRVVVPETKLELLNTIAGRWLDRGAIDRATPALREGRAVVDAWPRNSYSYRIKEFGEVLAVIDAPAARAIFEGKGSLQITPPGDPESRRLLGEAAVRVAAFDPAGAERMMAQGSGGPNIGDRETLAFRVARNMARADLPRARKLLQTVADRPDHPSFARPALVPYGLGLMAADRAATDPDAARTLLDEAFAGLIKLARDADGRTNPPASVLLAALLPAVEQAAPDRLAERAWLAASCRPPRVQEPDPNAVNAMTTLALFVSRFDRAAADAIAAPALDRLTAMLGQMDHPGWYDDRTFFELAAYDPGAIASLIRSLPPPARKSERAPDGQVVIAAEATARVAAAEMLGRPIGDRRRAAVERSSFLFRMLPERP